MALLEARPEVAHEGEVDDGLRALVAEDVLEFALAQVDRVHAHAVGVARRGVLAVDPADVPRAGGQPGDQAALAARRRR